MNDEQGCTLPTRIYRRLALSLPLSVILLLLFSTALLNAEPLRWKAYPTTTYAWFDTQEEAANDFQSKGEPYSLMTEALPEAFIND